MITKECMCGGTISIHEEAGPTHSVPHCSTYGTMEPDLYLRWIELLDEDRELTEAENAELAALTMEGVKEELQTMGHELEVESN